MARHIILNVCDAQRKSVCLEKSVTRRIVMKWIVYIDVIFVANLDVQITHIITIEKILFILAPPCKPSRLTKALSIDTC